MHGQQNIKSFNPTNYIYREEGSSKVLEYFFDSLPENTVP